MANYPFHFGTVQYDPETGIGNYTHYFTAQCPRSFKRQIELHNVTDVTLIMFAPLDISDYLYNKTNAKRMVEQKALAYINVKDKTYQLNTNVKGYKGEAERILKQYKLKID